MYPVMKCVSFIFKTTKPKNLIKFVLAVKFEKALRSNRIRLFESCTVMNIDDLVFYPVSLNNNSSNSKKQKRRRPLITLDRTHYRLLEFLGVINIQHTEYCYPLPYSFPGKNNNLIV